MIRYEGGILEWLSGSEARIRGGSPLCQTHDFIENITTRAWEHFVKPLLLIVFTSGLNKADTDVKILLMDSY